MKRIIAALALILFTTVPSFAGEPDYEATFGAGANAVIARELLNGLLDESARLIKDAYGIDGRSNNRLFVIWDTDTLSIGKLESNALAAAEGNIGIPYETKIVFNKELLSDMSGIGRLRELRMTVLHELTHGMQFTSDPGLMRVYANTYPDKNRNPLGQFLIEGMAEYVAGGNQRLNSLVRNRRKANKTDDQIVSEIISEMPRTLGPRQGYETSSEMTMYYIVSYLATRWYDSTSKAGGGTGVKGLIEYLEGHVSSSMGSAASDVFNAAVREGSKGRWGEDADLKNSMIGASKGSEFYSFVLGAINEDPSVDAGRIGGYYAEGGPAQPIEPFADTLVGHGFRSDALSGYGFSYVSIFGKARDYAKPQGGGAPSEPGGDPSGGDDSSWEDAPYTQPTKSPNAYTAFVQGGPSVSWSGRGGMRIIIAVDFDKFVGIILDGKPLMRGQDYTAMAGSTVIEFTESFLGMLDEGMHDLTVKFSDGGTAEISLKHGAPVGDTAPSGGSGGGCAAGVGMAAVAAVIAVRRRPS